MDHAGLYWLFVAAEHLRMDRTPYGLVLRSVCRACRHRWPDGSPLHLSEMDRFAEECAENGNLALLRWFYDDRGEMIPEWLPTVAARHGRIDVLGWLATMDVYPVEEACAEAAKHGRLKTLAWLRARRTPWDYRTTQNAELSGHLDVLDYAARNGCFWRPRLEGQVYPDVLEHEKNATPRPPLWKLVMYALENGFLMDDDACSWAARLNRFEDLKRLAESGLPLTVETFSMAARYATEEMMLWLRGKGCPRNESMSYEQLVLRGDFAFLKRTVDLFGLRADATVLAAAADTGRDDVFWWIRQRDDPAWCWTTASALARQGNLELLKEVVGMGCPVDESICEHACHGGWLDVLQWLVENGHASPTSDTLVWAARRGDLRIIRWLRDRGIPWTLQASHEAATCDRFEALVWMLEHGCPCHIRTIPLALKTGGVELFSRLLNRATIVHDWEAYRAYRFRDGDFYDLGRPESRSPLVKRLFEIAVLDSLISQGSIRQAKETVDLGFGARCSVSILEEACIVNCRLRLVRWLLRNGHATADSVRRACSVAPKSRGVRWLKRYCPDLSIDS